MATYVAIYDKSVNAAITSQIAVAITKDAKYAIQQSTDPVILKWANYVVPVAYTEAKKWQLVIVSDPVIADAVEVRDEDVQTAVTALVPTMAASYDATNPTPPA